MKPFRLKEIIIFIVVFLFLTKIVSADVFTRFVTSGTFGSQTNEETLNKCDNSTLSTYNSAFYDYFTVDNIDLPSVDELVSIDYCIQGRGDLNVGFNTEHLASFVGDNSEQCYNASVFDYPNIYENIWLHNGYGLFGGALNTNSFTDCLYVKINTVTPTPTPTATLTPSPTPTPIPTNTPTLTPMATSTPEPTSASTVTTSTNVSTSICNDTKPGSAPQLLLTTSSGPNSITLNWIKAKDPVSYYLVTFGTKPGEQLYGNPNIGDSNTTSYTINNLSGGKNYYFKVRAGNGCMPGDFSNEVIGRLTGGYITITPEDFSKNVLGVILEPSPKMDAVKSTDNLEKIKKIIIKNFLKIIFLVIVTILLGRFFYKKIIKNN